MKADHLDHDERLVRVTRRLRMLAQTFEALSHGVGDLGQPSQDTLYSFHEEAEHLADELDDIRMAGIEAERAALR